MDPTTQGKALEFAKLKLEIVIKEWDHCHGNIARLETIIFIIRGWAVAVATAAVAFAYTHRDDIVCYLSIGPLILLWLIDAVFKSFQRIFILRSREVERYLSSDLLELDLLEGKLSFESPATAKAFGSGAKAERLFKVFKAATLRNVILSYGPLILMVAVAAAIIPVLPPLPLEKD
ncbi:hypothetical protein [Rhizobium sp. L1K21]|uniref:hypothetical protein n=1 Tax=Rhizobium sp. L1K21 TaxID=2954933 RepID=UPI002092A9C2|nr:hypothetical protein [Rhizobium sp. L1K21]MCO6186592.1 hypothetical protein [Rhizobium sp. L1K21]